MRIREIRIRKLGLLDPESQLTGISKFLMVSVPVLVMTEMSTLEPDPRSLKIPDRMARATRAIACCFCIAGRFDQLRDTFSQCHLRERMTRSQSEDIYQIGHGMALRDTPHCSWLRTSKDNAALQEYSCHFQPRSK